MALSRPDWLPTRPGMLLPVVGAHVGALLLIASGRAEPVVATPARGLAVFDLPAVPTSAPTPPPAAVPVEAPLIAPPPPVVPVLAIAPPTLAVTAAFPAGNGVDCDLTDVVQRTVRDSPPARSALLMLPRDARSVANAIMLWDGQWSSGTTTATRYALGKVREVILTAIESASPECRAALQAGPRLATVLGTPDIVIGFGSGRWRWGDLAEPPAPTVAVNDVTGMAGLPAHIEPTRQSN